MYHCIAKYQNGLYMYSMYMYFKIIQLICNMGLSKYFYHQFTHMGLGFIGGFECNREEPLDDIKHSIYLHL